MNVLYFGVLPVRVGLLFIYKGAKWQRKLIIKDKAILI